MEKDCSLGRNDKPCSYDSVFPCASPHGRTITSRFVSVIDKVLQLPVVISNHFQRVAVCPWNLSAIDGLDFQGSCVGYMRTKYNIAAEGFTPQRLLSRKE